MQNELFIAGRIGMGCVIFLSALVDIKSHSQVFSLMKIKNVCYPWICFLGAIAIKVCTSFGIVFEIYPLYSALILAVYILIANVIFNNFWAIQGERRDFSMVMFLVHLSTCFGLLVIASHFSQ